MGLLFTPLGPSQDDLANHQILFCLHFPGMQGPTHCWRDLLKFSNRHASHQMALEVNWNPKTYTDLKKDVFKRQITIFQPCKIDCKYVRKWPIVLGFGCPDCRTRIPLCLMMGVSSQDGTGDDSNKQCLPNLSVLQPQHRSTVYFSMSILGQWGSCRISSRNHRDSTAGIWNVASQHGRASSAAHNVLLRFLP